MTLIDQHLDWCARRNLRPSYLAALRGTLERLDRDVGPIELVTEDMFEDWWKSLDMRAAGPLGAGTRVTYAAHVSSFYKWAILERIRTDDPTLRLIRPRLRRRLPRPIGDSALKRALEFAEPPVSTWLLLGALQGLRACEIATLCREDVRDGVIVVRDGKGGKQRIVRLHPVVEEALQGLPLSGALFVDSAGHAWRANTITARANRFLHSLGLTETLHTCRHRFGTETYRSCHDLRVIQELLGHSSPTTTAGYAAWDQSKGAEVVLSLRLP